MRKQRLSSVDLTWMIYERMREEIGGPRVPVAVVRDSKLGWSAILEGRNGRHLRPDAIRKLVDRKRIPVQLFFGRRLS